MTLLSNSRMQEALDMQSIKGEAGSVFKIIRELQGLTFNLLDGAAADTNIAVSGIALVDTPLFCIHISTKAAIATMADITSEVVILSAGNIQLTTTDTTSDQLLLIWYNRS